MTQVPEPYQNPDHDYSDPASRVNLMRAFALMHSAPRTCGCVPMRRLLPMTGTAWGFESIHRDDCGEHEDNQPASEVYLDTAPLVANATQAEAIWQASLDDGRGEN